MTTDGPTEHTEGDPSHSFIEEHLPASEEILFTLGNYQILKSIATGGMGEVFLAYDTICGRRIALKRIRKDLVDLRKINDRFLKEAHITSQLTHPSIIPIYSIHKDAEAVYYTMPYVQGETLKQILRKTRKQEKQGEKIDHIGGSIPALVRIFLNICQAVAYAHSKNILHRDLKPENIIVGQYGEVLILDWGLAKLTHDQKSDQLVEEDANALSDLTLIGKVVGTVNFMAPERAKGLPSTFQTDIYSLGVILYQILTLRYPFNRPSLKEFRLNLKKEEVHDPMIVAPYRDIPRILARIATRCLEKKATKRYQTVDDLIYDIENYLEGRSEWFQMTDLDPKNKEDWEFQENVYLAEHVAITRATEASDWLNLMISKSSFAENVRIEARIRFGTGGHGLGILLNVPESGERKQLNDGYCLWLGTEINPTTQLLRAAVEVIFAPEVVLKQEIWHTVRIDKVDNHIHVYINDQLQFSYISHLPLVGTHVGLISRDADYEIEAFRVYVAGQNVMVKCLAVPDAFLAHRNYDAALSEYRRIGYSFPGRAEGREALFRAGITLLEQAKATSDPKKQGTLLDEALKEFESLHNTPGAPLEYLGKALVYQALKEEEEEVKCYELAYRRYPNHPLLSILQEQITYRLHESSRTSRKSAYQFVLLTVRQLKGAVTASHVKKLLARLKKHWEPLFFIEEEPAGDSKTPPSSHHIAIVIAFWLARPYVLEEIIDELIKQTPLPKATLGNALFSLIKLGCWELAEKKLQEIDSNEELYKEVSLAIAFEREPKKEQIQELLSRWSCPLTFGKERLLLHLMALLIRKEEYATAHLIGEYAEKSACCSEAIKNRIAEYHIWSYLLESRWQEAGRALLKYPIEVLCRDNNHLHLLYGCWLRATEGEEVSSIHFSSVLELPYPRSWTLLGHAIAGKIGCEGPWFEKAFLWEKRQLYMQLQLYYHCCHDNKNALQFKEKFQKTVLQLI